MPQSIGELYVNLSVRSQGFGQQMAQAAESVAKTAQKIKDVTEKVGGFFNAMAATSGALVAVASQSNARVGREVDRLKGSFTILAEEISIALLPTIRELSNIVTGLVAAWRGLSPETRASVSSMAAFATAGALVTGALGKTMGLVEGVAIAIGAIGPAVLAALPTLAVLAVTLGGLALIAGAFYKSWHTAGSNVKAVFMELVSGLGHQALGMVLLFTNAATSVGTLLGGILSSFGGMVVTMLDSVTGAVRTVAGMLAPLAGASGLGGLAQQLERISKLTTADVISAGVSAAAPVAGAALGVAGSVAVGPLGAAASSVAQTVLTMQHSLYDLQEGFWYASDGLHDMVDDALDSSGLRDAFADLRGWVGDLLSGKSGREVAQEVDARKEYDVSTVGSISRGTAKDEVPQAARDIASGRGSSTWQAFTAVLQRTAAEAKRAAEQARASLVDQALGSLGRLGGIIQRSAQAAAAGPLAALASVAIDLLSQSAGFEKVMRVVNGILQSVADALGKLLEPLYPLLGAISLLVNGVLVALEPAFNALAAIITPLVPPLVVLAQLLGALAPVLAIVISVTQFVLQPFRLLAGPVMKALFEVLKFVGVAILTVVKGLAGVWNGIIGAVQSVFRALASIKVLGVRPLGFLGDWADGMNKARVDVGALAQSLHDLQGLSWDSAMAIANEEAARVSNTAAMNKATESLSNVPSAWRKALRIYESQDRQSGGTPSAPMPSTPSAPSGGTPERPPRPGQETNPLSGVAQGGLGSTLEAGAAIVTNITVNGATTEEALAMADQVFGMVRRRGSATRSGTSVSVGATKAFT